MTAMIVTRPVWRRFAPRFLERASAHVRAGGHAAIVHDEGRVDILLGVDEKGKITELGLWSLLALEQQRHRRVKEGPAAGLAIARAASHSIEAVLDWCDRDATHAGASRTIELDCLDCGACCHEAKVLLDEDDFERFREGGRGDLVSRAYIKRARDGKVTLRFAPDGRCQHLLSDLKCNIYALRPFNCRVFPVGSEACLAARESTLSLRD